MFKSNVLQAYGIDEEEILKNVIEWVISMVREKREAEFDYVLHTMTNL